MRALEGDTDPCSAERERAEAARNAALTALAESESTLRAFYEGSALLMALVERRGDELRMVSCNPALARMFGRTPESLRGARASDFIPRDDLVRAWLDRCGEVEREGAPKRFEWQRGVGSEARWFAATVSMVARAEGRHFCIVAEERSERVRLQMQLVLADRLASVGTLAAGVAHEINNPLTYVIANLEYVTRQLDTTQAGDTREQRERVTRALTQAREGAERVRLIVKNLRTFSRGDEEQRGVVSVREVLESAIDMAWNEIRHRAQFVRDYQNIPPVEANEARLGQVFLNLLLNAAQAIPEGNAAANHIRVSTRRVGDRAVIEFSDTGAGIERSNLKRVFDPFFTTRPVGEGTGLGLSVCHGIVTALGGELEAESKPGKGSTFRVSLPTTMKSRAPQRSSRPSAQPRGPRLKVLILDDEPNLRLSLRQIVALEHDAQDTSSGNEVLKRVREGERFDVILCDLMMPEISGVDVYQGLLEIAPEQAARVVFLTGGAFTPRTQDFLARVTNPRLEKPFNIDELLELIRKTAS